MNKIFKVFLFIVIILSFVGCRTQRILEKQVLHDSIYITKDRLIYKYVKDSVTEKEKISVYTKRDTLRKIDSVFVVKEKIRERWRLHTDTIAKTIYVYKDKGRITSKEVKTEETIFTTLFKHIKFLVLVMVIVFLFVVCRSYLKRR